MQLTKNISIDFDVFSGLGIGFQVIPGTAIETMSPELPEPRFAVLLEVLCFSIMVLVTKDA